MKSTRRNLRYAVSFTLLTLLTGAAFVLSLCIGSVSLPFDRIWGVVFGTQSDAVSCNIIMNIRMPRIILSLVLGGALSLSGFLIQTFFRNPIAGPFVLGISSGARMFLAFCTVVFSGVIGMMPVGLSVFSSFIGSLISMLIVLLFSFRAKSMPVLLIAGIMTGYICSALTDLLINFARDEDIVNLTHWSMGSFSASSWQDVYISLCIVIPSLIIIFLMSKPVGAYILGEAYSRSLGVNTKLLKVMLVLMTGILSSCVVAFAGPVSFVGIAVPHITRVIFKTSRPIVMIPAVFITGALFCMLSDLIARTLFSPSELSISTITAIFGAPVVLWLLLSRRRKNEW